MKQLFIPGSASAPSRRLILYFNGWALGPVAVEHLPREQDYDLLILWDYRDDQLDFDFHPYRELRLVAWSMGVWAADRFFSEHPRLREHLISGTAVAGTGYPMDDVYGIPEAVYQATLGSITEENRVRFDRRMLGGKTYRHLYEDVRERPTDVIYDELLRPYTIERDRPRPVPKPQAQGLWSHAFIGDDDRVIPPPSQEAYWREQGVPFTLIERGAHYLLSHFRHWHELW